MISSLIRATIFAEQLHHYRNWQSKIDIVMDEFFNKTIHLPRKAKKKRRKQLNKEYSFLVAMQKYDNLN